MPNNKFQMSIPIFSKSWILYEYRGSSKNHKIKDFKFFGIESRSSAMGVDEFQNRNVKLGTNNYNNGFLLHLLRKPLNSLIKYCSMYVVIFLDSLASKKRRMGETGTQGMTEETLWQAMENYQIKLFKVLSNILSRS